MNHPCMSEWITFLEMTERPEVFPPARKDFQIFLAEKDWRINCEWYQCVGSQWAWTDRLKWLEQEWRDYAESLNLETWIATFQGEPCGYFELLEEGQSVRIALLGLAPEFIGKGIGGSLLSQAIACAWKDNATRLFLDTCSKDHPNALPNYLRHGFRILRTEHKSA